MAGTAPGHGTDPSLSGEGAGASPFDAASLLGFIAGLREDRTRHPFTATVLHEGEDGESTHYRLEMWVDGATAACRTVDGAFGMRYCPATRVLAVLAADGAVHEEKDRDYPAGFAPLAMAHPLHLPIWGGSSTSGTPASVRRLSRTRFEVLVNAPDDGGAVYVVGRAVIDTELMAALEFEWFGARYRLVDPRRLVMPDWDALLG